LAGNQKEKENGWLSWGLIVFLFVIGLHPIALVLLFLKLFGSDEEQKASEKKTAAAPKGAVAAQSASAHNKAKRTVKKAMKAPRVKDSNAKVLQIIGIVLLAVGVLACIDPVHWMLLGEAVRYYLEDLLYGLAFAAAGGGMLAKGMLMSKELQRYKRYLAVLGDRSSMPLREIARVTGHSRRRVIRDLEKMIDKGFFGGAAYLHMEMDCFCRTSRAAEELRRERQAQQVPPEAEQGYSGILRNIRRANDRIADPVLSEKIDRLEEITANIFRAVEDDPAKQKQIATFLNYYLPTTQKLLDSYAEFESAGIEGENLRQAKQRIEATMDSIIQGFEHQLDALYQSDAMDVDSEIRVMETMLKRQRSSVAEDFGLGGTVVQYEETDL